MVITNYTISTTLVESLVGDGLGGNKSSGSSSIG
jgi:hypothetical protein